MEWEVREIKYSEKTVEERNQKPEARENNINLEIFYQFKVVFGLSKINPVFEN